MITWKEKTGQFASGYSAYLGGIHVGGTHWGTSKQPGGPWVATCILPGISIRQELRAQMTEEDARKIVELAANKWLEKAGLVAK